MWGFHAGTRLVGGRDEHVLQALIQLGFTRFDDLDGDLGRTLVNHVELSGGGIGEVEYPVAMEGPPIIDSYQGAQAVVEISDLDQAGNGQVFVSGGHGVHVIALAAAGAATVEALAIPGGRTLFLMARGVGLDEISLAFHHVGG